LRRALGISPEFIEMEPDPAAMLSQADAALLIGDPALRVTLKAEALMSKLPSSEICCGGDPGEQPVPGVDTLFLYDVAYQWREMTGRPCVLALWVARREAATPAVVAISSRPESTAWRASWKSPEDAAQQLGLPAAGARTLPARNIDFSLDAENRAGLELYFERCAEAALIPRARPLELVAAPGDAGVALHGLPRTQAAT